MPAKLTVCIGVYNGANRLPKALASVRAQTFEDFEILVVDDGSIDDSAAIAESFGARVVRQENTGLGGARKRLVELCETEFIAFMDDDDEWTPNKLEAQFPKHVESGCVLSHTGGWWVWPDGRQEFRELRPTQAKTSYDHVLPDNLIMAPSVIFNRQAMLDAGNFSQDVRFASDWYGWLLLARMGDFLFVDEPLLLYHRREGQNTQLGLRFFDKERAMLEQQILPKWDLLLSKAEPDRKAYYRKGMDRYLGQLNETVARHYWVEQGAKSTAIKFGLKAIQYDPRRRSAYTMIARLLIAPKTVKT